MNFETIVYIIVFVAFLLFKFLEKSLQGSKSELPEDKTKKFPKGPDTTLEKWLDQNRPRKQQEVKQTSIDLDANDSRTIREKRIAGAPLRPHLEGPKTSLKKGHVAPEAVSSRLKSVETGLIDMKSGLPAEKEKKVSDSYYGKLLQNKNSLKTAIILSEVLNRKEY